MSANAPKPLASICVPTYNGEGLLVECLESICAQTMGDFEVVVVDDASTDRSHQIALDFAARDARFRVYRNESPLGMVRNWNRCLELSRGEWLKLVFQDDLIAPRCLERLVGGCQQRQKRFAFCRRQVLFDDSTPGPVRDFFLGHQKLVSTLYGPEDSYMDPSAFAAMTLQYPCANLIGEPTTTLFHRSVMEEFGLFTPAMIQLCDSEYWTRLGSNLGVVHIAEPLATFRVHSQSATSRNLSRREYALKHLEPLIIRYVFVYEKHYAALRKRLFLSSGRLVTWWRLVWTADEARKAAMAHAANPDLLQQWNDTIRIYPRLKTLAAAGHILKRVRSGLAATGLARCL